GWSSSTWARWSGTSRAVCTGWGGSGAQRRCTFARGGAMRSDFVVRGAARGLRPNVAMTVAMVLTTAISLGLVGTGLLAVRTIDRTEQLYSDRVEGQGALASDVSATEPASRRPIC